MYEELTRNQFGKPRSPTKEYFTQDNTKMRLPGSQEKLKIIQKKYKPIDIII